jgi:hypothetical protein
MHTVIFKIPICVQEKLVQMLLDQIENFRSYLSFTYMSTFSKKSSQKISDQTESCGKNRSLFVSVRKEIVNRN